MAPEDSPAYGLSMDDQGSISQSRLQYPLNGSCAAAWCLWAAVGLCMALYWGTVASWTDVAVVVGLRRPAIRSPSTHGRFIMYNDKLNKPRTFEGTPAATVP